MKKTILLPGLFLLSLTVLAQQITNRGKEFWTGFGHHSGMEIPIPFPNEIPQMVLYFSAEEAAKVVVTIEGTIYREEYFVPANSVVASKTIPMGLKGTPSSPIDARLYTKPVSFGGTSSEGLFTKKGIHIESDVPIVAYTHIYAGASSAATMLMPVESWGYGYSGLTIPQTINGADDTRFSWMFVEAYRNNTKVRIIPSVPTRSGKPAGVPIDVVLNKGEIYQFMAGAKDKDSMYNLTGTTVQSLANDEGVCVPFATFIGASGVYLACPTPGGKKTEDNLFQQMMPHHAWGRRYLTTPSSSSEDPGFQNFNFFRIQVTDPATVVKRNGVVLSGLNNNCYDYFSNTSDYIEADKPIMLLQAFPSQSNCNYVGKGDPEMVFLSPIEQGINRVGLYRNKNVYIDWNFISLTIPTTGLSSLTINGSNTWDHSYPHPNLPGYSVVVNRWRSTWGDPQVIVQSDSAFTAVTYGLGDAETYAYNAGTYINNLNGLGEIKNTYNTADTANPYTCTQTPFSFSVLVRYQPTKIFWQLSKLSGIVYPANDVLVNAPVPSGEELVHGVKYFRYTIPGEYRFLKPGKFIVPVFSSHPTVDGCDNTEQLPFEIESKDQLFTDFNIIYNNCKLSEDIKFAGDEKFTDGTSVKQWNWSFTDGTNTSSASGQLVNQLFNTGLYTARLIAVDANACIADTSKSFRLSANPIRPDLVPASALCAGSTVTLKEQAHEAGVKEWYWDFGDGQKTTVTTNGQEQTHIYASPGIYTVKHLSGFSASCVSDTASLTITILAKPAISIAYPQGCLPTDGVVTFVNNSSGPNGQLISTHAWTFGDAAATAANPNTSDLVSPAHSFQQGSYAITYKLVTEAGCIADTAFTAVFNLKPILNFPNPVAPAVCENQKQPVSVALATVTNNVPGTGSYKGPGTSADGQFQPGIAGPGTHTIWYIFKAQSGCTDSISSTIIVNASPKALFTATKDACLNKAFVLSDASIISTQADPAASIQTWTWDFGDGSPMQVENSNTPVSHFYTAAGNYTAKLTVGSNQACASEPYTQIITVHALPLADFALPEKICLPGDDAQFLNKTTNSEAGNLTYQWNFGDGAASTTADPVHRYNNKQDFQVTLIAGTAFGCTDTVSKLLSLNLFKDKPVAGFQVAPERICQGGQNQFTDLSTAPNSKIEKWTWDFGDGTSSSQASPVKTFKNYGNFQVSLQVTNSEGCVSDLLPGATKLVTVIVQPQIDAGPSIAAKEGSQVILMATAANAADLKLQWSPPSLLNDATLLRPAYIAFQEQLFQLTATGGEGECMATDTVRVKILRPVKAANAFSPNGDGIHDLWEIPNLSDYPGCTVEVFNRYGQLVYQSTGYSRPWDGTRNNVPLPTGTYYYIINLKNGFGKLTGSVSIIR